MKVLIVEDNQDLNEMLALALSIKKFDVKSSFDGEQGLRDFFSYKPDLVLLDLMMPKMDGREVFEKIRKSKPTPNIVVISNLDKEKLNEKSIFKDTLYINKSDHTPKEIIDNVLKQLVVK